MRSSLKRLALPLVGLLLLAGCGKDKQAEQAALSATPAKAVMASVHLIKAGDFDGLMQHVLTPADYKAMRADWTRDHDASKISAEDRQRFAQNMARLTAPDAEQKLFAEVKPQLAVFDAKYKVQLPLYLGMGQTLAAIQIDKSTGMTPEQKTQAKDVLAALASWVGQTAWSDPVKARQAISIVVDTARKLDLKTLDQAYALKYPDAMQRYATAWTGSKQVLAVYGLPINDILDSVQAKTVSENSDHARVAVNYSILGKPISTTLDMVRVDGRWYEANILKGWEDRRAKDQARNPQPGAAASTASH